MTQICTATQGFGLLHRQDLARMLLTHSILCSVYETCQRENKAQSLGGPDRQMDMQTDISLHKKIMETMSTVSVL